MNISPVSFGRHKSSMYLTTHSGIDKLANKYTNNTQDDELLIKQAHDVLDIVPWTCSEGDTIEKEDRVKSDGFMETLRRQLQRGNKALAYAMGSLISSKSLAGKADNAGFDDLPLGEIENLRAELVESSYIRNPFTGAEEKDPQMEKIENEIYNM